MTDPLAHVLRAAALAALAASCGGVHAGTTGDGGTHAPDDGSPGDGGPAGDATDGGGTPGSGSNTTGLPVARAAQLAAGRLHACALTTTGAVRCWGYPEQGQLGDGTPLGTTTRSLPVAVTGLASGVLAIATNTEADSTCAITAARGVRCWGDNSFGQLGDGTTTSSPVPVDVTGVTGATAIAVGSEHACAVVGGGTVLCWGADDYGDLGDGGRAMQTTPVQVAGLTGVTALAAGRGQTCAITASAGMVCWGSNLDGEAGTGVDPETTPAFDTPTAVSGLDHVTQITAGANNACAIANGTALCWGDNEETQLGNGTGGMDFDLSTLPVTVTGLAGLTDLDVAGGFGLAVIGGAVRVWGVFAIAQQATPIAAPALPEAAVAVAGGGDGYACAIGQSGAIYCWGDNSAGTAGIYDPDDGSNYVTTPEAIESF